MILKYWLARPSVAPTCSNSTPGTFLFRHRRVNPDGTYTAASVATGPFVLPNTLTPEAYDDPTLVARDEFLISNDGGTTWRIVPRTSPLTGPQTISSFNSSWTVTSLTDTQTVDYTAVDFGEFLSGDSSIQTIWIINQTQTISSLRFEVLDDFDKPTDALSGILEIAITGIADGTGDGTLNTSFNDTKISDRTVFGSNWFPLTSLNPSAIRVELQLVNYPLSGIDQNIDYQLSVVPNSSPTPTVANPVRAGRIIDSVEDEGIVNESYLLNDGDGTYVYLTSDDALTIGNEASGADIAELWMDRLFALVWRIYPTNELLDSSGNPVSRGTSAAADWAANRRLTLPHLLEQVLAGRSTDNELGTEAGNLAHTLSVSELPSHNHSLSTDGSHTHTESSAGSHTHTALTDGSHSHTTGSDGSHSHGPGTLSTGTQSASHTHSIPGGFFAGASPPGSGTFTLTTTAGNDHRVTSPTNAESANHTHNVTGGTTASAGSHTHSVSTAGSHTHSTDSQGSHTHTIDSAGDHTHTVGNTGGGVEFDLRQPTHYVHKLISTGY